MNSPIATAVLPLKEAAVARAGKEARELIDRVLAKLAANGWNVDLAYPRGDSMRDDRRTYMAKRNANSLATRLTQYDRNRNPISRGMRDPHYVTVSVENEVKFITECRLMAAQQYEAFVSKLEQKVGEHTEASLEGNHVWGRSILTVTTPRGVERWMTQQIVNQSVLGTLFNQWPSRKVK